MTSNMCMYMSEDISGAERAKVVQTEVPRALYDRFSRVAADRGETIKEAALAAIEGYADRHEPVDPDDPLFAPLEADVAGGEDDASERVDEIAYGADDG